MYNFTKNSKIWSKRPNYTTAYLILLLFRMISFMILHTSHTLSTDKSAWLIIYRGSERTDSKILYLQICSHLMCICWHQLSILMALSTMFQIHKAVSQKEEERTEEWDKWEKGSKANPWSCFKWNKNHPAKSQWCRVNTQKASAREFQV